MTRVRSRIHMMVQAAVIAALYTVLSVTVCIPINFFQLRPAEALTVLPAFTPAAIPGVTLGCLIANYLTGAQPLDIVFGTLATLLGAIGTYLLRRNRFYALFPPILSNTLILPPIIYFVYQAPETFPFLLLTVFIGELLSAGVLGFTLHKALRPLAPRLFLTKTVSKKDADTTI